MTDTQGWILVVEVAPIAVVFLLRLIGIPR